MVTQVNVWVIAIPLISLVAVVVLHIFAMARWSGKVDANLTQIMGQPAQWTTDLNAVAAAFRIELASIVAANHIATDGFSSEIRVLRDARHASDGMVARHDGQLREIEKTHTRLEDRLERMTESSGGLAAGG